MGLNDYEKERYDTMRRKSSSGSISTRNRKRTTSISLKDYLKRNKALIGTCILVTSVALTGSSMLAKAGKEQIQKIALIEEISSDFYENVLKDESHRNPNDRSKYFLDYSDIARNAENYGDFDEAVYFLERHLTDSELDNVLACTKYESFDNFKEVKGYGSTKEFLNEMEKRFVIADEIKEKEQELQRMQEEHKDNLNENEMSFGGK